MRFLVECMRLSLSACSHSLGSDTRGLKRGARETRYSAVHFLHANNLARTIAASVRFHRDSRRILRACSEEITVGPTSNFNRSAAFLPRATTSLSLITH